MVEEEHGRDEKEKENEEHMEKSKLEGFSDETFITNLRGEKSSTTEKGQEVKAMSQVQELHRQLGSVVGNLNEKISNVLKKQEEEFLAAYRAHMFNVQKELQALRAKLSDSEVKLNRDEKLRKLEEEKEWYRREALRLDNISTDNTKDMQYMKEKLAGVEDDRKWLEKQLKTCMKQNKFLRAELEIHITESQGSSPDNAHTDLDLHDQINQQSLTDASSGTATKMLQASISDSALSPNEQSNGCEIPSISNRTGFPNERRVKSSLARYEPTLAEKQAEAETRSRRIFRQLKEQLLQEKKKVYELRASVVTEQTERSDMEKLLVKSIDAVKKEIYRRRLKSRGKERKGKFSQVSSAGDAIPRDEYGRIRLRDFSDVDKRRVFHELLSNEQVFTHLYDLVYGSVSNNIDEREAPKPDPDGRINASFFPGIQVQAQSSQ